MAPPHLRYSGATTLYAPAPRGRFYKIEKNKHSGKT